MGKSKQQLGEKVMSSLEALRINISEMIGSVQKVYIICYVKELKYVIKVNGATEEDDTLIINVSKDGEITHVERFSTEFDVTSAEEGIQKIVEFETRKKSPENVMSYLYSLRTNICHHVESTGSFCIHVYVMERQYKIKKKGRRDDANGITICIDEKRNMQIQVHRFPTEFDVTSAEEGIQKIVELETRNKIICMGKSKQQLEAKVMSSLEALRINISEMIGSVQKVYIICYVKELKYVIKVNGATEEDDTLIINVSKDGEITHVERFSTEFDVTSAEEGIQKIVEFETRKKSPENVMSYLYSLRTNICHHVESNESFCIHVYVMERQYKIKKKGRRDKANGITICIDEKRNMQIQVHRFPTEFDVTSAEEGIQKIVELETRNKIICMGKSKQQLEAKVMSSLQALRIYIPEMVGSDQKAYIVCHVEERKYVIKVKGATEKDEKLILNVSKDGKITTHFERFSTEFDVTSAEEGIQKIVELEKINKIICMGESEQQLGTKAMSALQALRTDIPKMVYSDQRVYILCHVESRKYIIKVKGATDKDDLLTINVSKDGEITHFERFSREFDVTSAKEGILKIVEREKRNKPPEKVMSCLYRLRTHICHQVGSNEKICIQVCVMERRYEIKVNGGGDEDNTITISIDEKGNAQTQMNRLNSFDIESDSPYEGIQKILNVRYCVFSTDHQKKIEELRTDLPKKLYGEVNVKVIVYVDQMCFTVNVKKAIWKVVVNITESKTDISVGSLGLKPTLLRLMNWLPEHVFPVLKDICNAPLKLKDKMIDCLEFLLGQTPFSKTAN